MRLILDTNIFVAAGFNPDSSSARIVNEISDGKHKHIWNNRTRSETRKILRQIPPLDWKNFKDLFPKETHYKDDKIAEDDSKFESVADPEDRKFAALAKASGATLVTNDSHLLDVRNKLDIPIKTPGELF